MIVTHGQTIDQNPILRTEKILVKINGVLDIKLDFYTIKTCNKLFTKHHSENKLLLSTYNTEIPILWHKY